MISSLSGFLTPSNTEIGHNQEENQVSSTSWSWLRSDSFKFNFNLLKIDNAIQSFFQKIDDKFLEYKNIKADENRRIRIEKIEEEKREKERLQIEKKENEEKLLKEKLDYIEQETVCQFF